MKLAGVQPEVDLPSPNTVAEASGGDEWALRAAAGCYFHSGLPTVMRAVRKRFEVSVTDGRKISLRRRTSGSARILYYHRVNNENDPFFDAMPVEVFESQVRYLARHYRVVSLAEIVRHLQEGASAEGLVGITFDDGYRDNYENAFPILKRYNVPATIFLTTGSLDSGEPLWFEQLAEAIKKSSREYIDVDGDPSRRLWLRTPAERLDSNSKLFTNLRQLHNTDRLELLAQLLRQLGAPKSFERRNKMLTWDQVREMNRHGIDFGGHTVTHPFLSRLTPPEAAWEAQECKRRIEAELQRSVEHFAYPNGRTEDLGPANREVLRAAGYRAAVTTIWGINSPLTDPMELRRGGPWESSPAVFAYKLDWYQLANQ
jgi:peptidoglycan/xylan/chitin deacetylase (PgdA/CDA1 family)